MLIELSEYLSLMGIAIGFQELESLVTHLEMVLAANDRINLTRITDPSAALRLHTADSLSVLEDLNSSAPGDVLDLGSGAGFPGIPLAVCSQRRIDLADSVAKKMREVRGIVLALGLEPRVGTKSERAESLARTHAGEYSVVVARAVSELPALVELASPLLSVGGRLICMKGSPEASEVRRAEKVCALTGMRPEHSRSFELPEGVGHRSVYCYLKASVGPTPLPRREGLAQHSPLA